MNELAVFYNENWIYFKTDQPNASKAYTEYTEACENAGINIDNMRPTQVVLRGKDDNDIDELQV